MNGTKEQLIYDCVTEAVMQARIEVGKRSSLFTEEQKTLLDDLLYKAQLRAGSWAVKAHRADGRKFKTAVSLLRHEGEIPG